MLLNQKLLSTIFGGILLCAAANTAKAAFIVIPSPNPTYIASTTLVPIPPVATVNTLVANLLSGGGLTIGLTSPDAGTVLFAEPPVPVGFATWGIPPAVENSTPPVLFDQTPLTCAVCTLTLTFSTPVKTFGVELEQDPLPTTHTFTETFFNGATPLGSIMKTTTSGRNTASLFAASTDQQFTSVNITIDGTDFAAAQFRFGQTTIVPEPGTMLLLACGLLGLAYRKLR